MGNFWGNIFNRSSQDRTISARCATVEKKGSAKTAQSAQSAPNTAWILSERLGRVLPDAALKLPNAKLECSRSVCHGFCGLGGPGCKMRYLSAAHAFDRWTYLHALTLSGGLKSLDMEQACANVHNTATDTVVTDHPHLSELDERLELDRCMAIVALELVGIDAFVRWGNRRYQQAKVDDLVRWVDGCVEFVLKQEGYLVCR